MNLPRAGTPGWRRRIGMAALAVGLLLVVLSAGKDIPHEQPFVFRLEDAPESGTRLTASFTRVGEREARVGFSVELVQGQKRDVRQTVRLPNGDYVVTVELERAGPGSSPSSARVSGETSVARRVTLTGSETVVPLASRD